MVVSHRDPSGVCENVALIPEGSKEGRPVNDAVIDFPSRSGRHEDHPRPHKMSVRARADSQGRMPWTARCARCVQRNGGKLRPSPK